MPHPADGHVRRVAPDYLPNGSRQVSTVDRLGQVRGIPAFECASPIIRPGKRGHCDRRRLVASGAESPQQHVAVYIRHRDVRDKQVHSLALQKLEGRFSRFTLDRARAALFEQCRQHLAGICLIVDHQDRDVVQANVCEQRRRVRRHVACCGCAHRQPDRNRGALILAGAVRPNLGAEALVTIVSSSTFNGITLSR